MRASIRDKSALSALSLTDLLEYLRAHSWQPADAATAPGSVYVSGTSSHSFELFVPASPTTDDYPTRISQVLRVLSAAEDRSELDILRDIKNVSVDVIRLRAPEVSPDRNSTRFQSGVHLLEHVMEMMMAAASAAVAPRKVVPTRRPPQVEEYLRWLELGPSEKGSYVVTILSRVQPMLVPSVPSILEVIETPFPRAVTRSLSKALVAAKSAISASVSQGGYAAFNDAVALGVSANLCEALSQLPKSYENLTALDVDIHWAPKMPEETASTSFAFLQTDAEILLGAARFLRETEPSQDLPITGVVINLHRDEGAQNGVTTISCVVRGKLIKLHVPLAPSDYDVAIEAHRIKKGVIFRADVVQSGRAYSAQNVANFRLVD